MSVLLTEKAKKKIEGWGVDNSKNTFENDNVFKTKKADIVINFQAALLKVRFEFMLILKIETAAVSWSGQRFCWGNTGLF